MIEGWKGHIDHSPHVRRHHGDLKMGRHTFNRYYKRTELGLVAGAGRGVSE